MLINIIKKVSFDLSKLFQFQLDVDFRETRISEHRARLGREELNTA